MRSKMKTLSHIEDGLITKHVLDGGLTGIILKKSICEDH